MVQPMAACPPARILSRGRAKTPAKLVAFAKMASFVTKSQANASGLNDAKPPDGGTAIANRAADAMQQMKTMFASYPSSPAHVRQGKVANGTSTARSKSARNSDRKPVERIRTHLIRKKPVNSAVSRAALLKQAPEVADDVVVVAVEEIHAEMLARTIAPLVT